uniref:Uncharacterized protein n=1 Tax=Cajanus cajan TaxID=3821 RepID=A0A151R179_CAJCA|nr:hypothetical protein KK1_042683 [Cajanus cajan]
MKSQHDDDTPDGAVPQNAAAEANINSNPARDLAAGAGVLDHDDDTVLHNNQPAGPGSAADSVQVGAVGAADLVQVGVAGAADHSTAPPLEAHEDVAADSASNMDDAIPPNGADFEAANDDTKAANDSHHADNSLEGMPPLEYISNDQNQLSPDNISSAAHVDVAGAVNVTAQIHIPATSSCHKKWDFAAIMDAASESEPEQVDLLPHVPKTTPRVLYTRDVESDNLLNKAANFYRKDWANFPPAVQHDMALLEAAGYDWEKGCIDPLKAQPSKPKNSSSDRLRTRARSRASKSNKYS